MQVRAVNPRVVLVLAALALAAAAPISAQAPAGGTPVLVSGDTNIAGVVAEVTECKRKEGVLSLKVRFRNTGSTRTDFRLIDGRNHDDLYVTAAAKKYFVLRDSEKTPVSAPTDGFGILKVELAPGGSWTWWAKYPAPPPEIKAVSYYLPISPPLEDIPISDL